MKEELLHFIWKYQKLEFQKLHTSLGQSVQVINPGDHNQLSGPDFFNAKIKIGPQLWAGNIEIHLKSSDWYAHGHERDPNFNNVILHVVWEDNVEVFRKDESRIPALELRHFIPNRLLENYRKLFSRKKQLFINCQNHIGGIDGFLRGHWLERLYFDRLEQKNCFALKLLEECKGDWENVCFVLLLKSFGSVINGNAFYELGRALDFSVVKKLQKKPLALESLLFGASGLLHPVEHTNVYHSELLKEYTFLKQKFGLPCFLIPRPRFFKLRPANFPTIRLSQMAILYASRPQMFSRLMEMTELREFHNFFKLGTNPYWENHFTFQKASKHKVKLISKKFIDLLIINTVIPLKFCYAKYRRQDANDEITGILSGIKSEENNISNKFKSYGVEVKNAMESQAALQLYNNYCAKNRCLHCAIGVQILSGK